MRNLKKVLSLALALVMLLGMMMVGAGAADTGFEDDASIKDSFKTAAAVNKALGLMTGDGTNLNPTANITRAEAFILSLRVDGSNANEIASRWPVSEKPFNDVTTGKWYAPYLAYGKELGLIAGSNGSYNPDGDISVRDFSILLLGKLGFDPANYQGAGYTTNSLRDAVKVGLYENLGNVNADHVLTRQEACQMVFQALIYSPEGGMIYPVVAKDGKGTTLEFDNMKDAALYATLMKDTHTLGEAYASTAGSLGEKAFGLKPNATVDSLGRATTTWTANGGVKVELSSAAPVKTYTGRVKASEIYADLGLTKAITVNEDKDCKDTWHLNGINFQWSEPTVSNPKDPNHPGGDHNKYANYTCMSGEISKNSNFSLANNMSTTEVYYDGTNVRIVTWDTYVGEVTKVTPANEKKDIKRSIDVKVFGLGIATVETEDYAKGDYLLVTTNETGKGCNACYAPFDGDNFEIVGPATVIEDVSVTSYKKNVTASSSVTFDGETYAYSSQAIGAENKPALGEYTIGDKASYTFVLDANGNVAVSKAYSVESETLYAVALDYGEVSTGSTLNGKTYQAKLLFTDGSTKVVNINKFDGKKIVETGSGDAGAAAADEIIYGSDEDGKLGYTNTENIFVSYTVKDEVYALKPVKPDGDITVSAANFASAGVTGNKANYADSNVADSKTVFLLNIDDEIKVVTGVANLPSMKETATKPSVSAAFAVKGIDAYVYLVAASTDDAVSSTQYAYIFDKSAPSVTANGTEFDAVVGGELTTLTTKDADVVTAVGNLNFGTNVVSGLVTYKTAGGMLVSDGLAVKEGKAIDKIAGNVMILEAAVNGSTSWQFNDKTEVYVIEGGDVTVTTMEDITADEEGKIFVENAKDGSDVATVIWVMR